MTRVIVLRPEPGARETLARAARHGLDARAIPLFEIEPLEWDPPDPEGFDAVLLTSANAVRFGGESLQLLRALPAYAVGEPTAAAARAAGFDIAASGDAGVERLLGSVEAGLRLLHLCGEDRVDVPGARQAIEPIVVYRARPAPAPDLEELAGTVVLIHSPRAGHRLADLVTDRASIRIAAISPAAAAAAGDGWGAVESAPDPTDEALLALAERLCDKGGGE